MKELDRIIRDIRATLANLKSGFAALIAKAKNAEGNNLALGLKHLESGNLQDAKLRFWLATKLNPKNEETQQKLAEVNAAIAKANA